jgi:hypothetical protein
MSRSKQRKAEIIAAVKQLEAGRQVEYVACEVGVSTHTISAWKAEARWHGCERGAGGQAVARRELSPAQVGRRPESGQGRPAIGYRKKRLRLTTMKATVEPFKKSTPSPSVVIAVCYWFRF